MNIKQLAALFGGESYREIARNAWPHGAVLKCECGYEQAITVFECATYLRDGWPKHCGKGMIVEPVEVAA